MASTPTYNNNSIVQNLPIEEETPYSTPKLRPVARRTSSFSSSSPSNSLDSSIGSSSSFSYSEEFPPFSPSTPLNFKGIPFSWEKIPGIPKNQGSKKKEPSDEHLLPLPPAGNSNSSTKKSNNQEEKEISPKKHNYLKFQRDPFYAALVECSKDEDNDHSTNFWKGGSKIISRTLSDRFGFINMYTSCKRTCAVSESLVYLPRSSTPHYLLNRRSS